MRTTLDIEEDVLLAAKDLAARTGQTAGQVISSLARRGLELEQQPPEFRNGVPLIRRKPGAPIATLELVNRLRDEE